MGVEYLVSEGKQNFCGRGFRGFRGIDLAQILKTNLNEHYVIL